MRAWSGCGSSRAVRLLALQPLVTHGGYRYCGRAEVAANRYLLLFARQGLWAPMPPMPPKDLRQLLGAMPAR
jgi:hypothetical protein